MHLHGGGEKCIDSANRKSRSKFLFWTTFSAHGRITTKRDLSVNWTQLACNGLQVRALNTVTSFNVQKTAGNILTSSATISLSKRTTLQSS
jgi:hypothetical protein